MQPNLIFGGVINIVNVIIPTYKARETLPKALDSLVAQTKKLFIVTVVQDCDGEDYTDIIEEYRRRGLNIRLISLPENRGPGGARQAGMDADKLCDYFMFLDADDMYAPRAIEMLSREAMGNNADIVASDFIAERKATPGILMDVMKVPVTWCHGRIYKKKFLQDNNIRFLDGLRVNEDAYFNLIAHNIAERKYKIKEVTYIWRDNQNSLTRAGDREDFFKRTWESYIISQVEGLLWIINSKGKIEPGLLGATLLYVYGYWMTAKHYKVVSEDIIKEIHKLKNNSTIIATLKEEAFWDYIVENLKGATKLEDNILFYQDRFCDWLKEYIADSLY